MRITLLYVKYTLFFIVDVILHTQSWGYEVSWKIIDTNGDTVCNSKPAGSYSSYKVHPAEQCILTKEANYNLICEDTYGDGWNGGSLSIQGSTYCAAFRYPGCYNNNPGYCYSKTESLTIKG